MDERNLICALREIQRSALSIQQTTMELLEQLQEKDGVVDDTFERKHLSIPLKSPSDFSAGIKGPQNDITCAAVQKSLPEKLYDLLTGDENHAMTIDEIEKRLPNVPFNSIQRPLYDLMMAGLVSRKMRKDDLDKRKSSWEYWKKSAKEAPVFDVKRHSVDRYAILAHLPEQQDSAVSVLEIAQEFDIPKSTIRDAIKKLREENLVQWVESKNYKNQNTEKYYKHSRGL